MWPVGVLTQRSSSAKKAFSMRKGFLDQLLTRDGAAPPARIAAEVMPEPEEAALELPGRNA
jgi:hypothetical protein